MTPNTDYETHLREFVGRTGALLAHVTDDHLWELDLWFLRASEGQISHRHRREHALAPNDGSAP